MAAPWILIQLWILCCATFVVAGLLNIDVFLVFRSMPVLAFAYLLVRAFV